MMVTVVDIASVGMRVMPVGVTVPMAASLQSVHWVETLVSDNGDSAVLLSKLSDGSYGPVGRIYSLPLGDPKLESRYIASGKHRA